MLPARPGDGEVGVAVVHACPRLLQQLDDFVRRRLPVVVDVLLVREAEHQHPRQLHGLGLVVERLGHLRDDVVRHRGVHLAGQLDEARPDPVLGGLPREVERVERDAVSAQARAGVEGREAKRLRLGRFDDLPDVDTHLVERDLQLVDQGDVDRAIDVLEQLARLGDARRRDRNDLVDGRRVEGDRDLGRDGLDAADHLGNRAGVELRVARILAFGREGQQEVGGALQAGGLEDRLDLFVGRAGIRGRLEDDELAGPQALCDLAGRIVHVREVGFAVLAEWRRHADQYRVAVADAVEVGGGREAAACDRGGDARRADVLDIRLAAREGLDLLRVEIEADDREACLFEDQGQRQPDVALADDADAGGPPGNALLQLLDHLLVSGPVSGALAIRSAPLEARAGRAAGVPALRGRSCAESAHRRSVP